MSVDQKDVIDMEYAVNKDFIHLAKMFCDFVENPTAANSRDFLKTIQV